MLATYAFDPLVSTQTITDYKQTLVNDFRLLPQVLKIVKVCKAVISHRTKEENA